MSLLLTGRPAANPCLSQPLPDLLRDERGDLRDLHGTRNRLAIRVPGIARPAVGRDPPRAARERFTAALHGALQSPSPLRHNGHKVPFARAPLKRALRTLAG